MNVKNLTVMMYVMLCSLHWPSRITSAVITCNGMLAVFHATFIRFKLNVQSPQTIIL